MNSTTASSYSLKTWFGRLLAINPHVMKDAAWLSLTGKAEFRCVAAERVLPIWILDYLHGNTVSRALMEPDS